MSAAEFRVRVFGATTVKDANGEALHLTTSMQRMLSFIVAAGPTGVSADRALTELADGDGSAKAGSRLRMDVSRLRKRIGADTLPSSLGQWRLGLDPNNVDYFTLLNSAKQPLPNRPSELLALLSGEPFPDSGASPLVEQAIQKTLAMRQSLLHRACDERPDLIDPQVLLAARIWVDQNPLNEDLITFVTRCHLTVGETTAARELLSNSLAAFSEILGEVAPRFTHEFEDELGPIRPALSGLGEPAPARHSFLNLEDSIHIVGRAAEEEQLITWLEQPDARPLLLHGASGAGKTTLLRAVAHEAHAQGQVVIAGAAREFDTTPYATFARALGKQLDDHLTSKDPQPESMTWSFTRNLLGDHAQDTVLIIDDIQWLDSLSRRLLSFLLRSEIPGLRLLLCGRATSESSQWHAIENEALGAGATELTLDGLNIAGIEALVSQLRPEATLARQQRLAAQVLELSNGLPGVACPLIGDADEAMLRVTTSSQAQSLTWFIDNLSQPAKFVGQAAAVLAQPLTYPSLAALTKTSDTELLTALEELSSRGILRSEQIPGTLSFTHALIRDAFLQDTPPHELHSLHRRAADVVNDVHHKATHQLASIKPGEEILVANALIASADAHYTNNSLSEAAFTYNNADELDAVSIPTKSLIQWAGATDRLHLDGSPIRQRAFDAAMTQGSLDLALEAACSGLPEAEDAAGNPERISLLQEIDADLLPQSARFTHSATLGRQLMLTGDAQAARRWVELALATAETDHDLDIAARIKWLSAFSSSTATTRRNNPNFFPPFSGDTPDAILQLQAIDALASGDIAEAREHNQIVTRRLQDNPDAITYWLQKLFESTLASAQGNQQEATSLSEEAMRHGTTYGIREAATAWLAQRFIRTWMTSGPETFLTEIGDTQNLQVEHSPLAEASIALALYRAGMKDDATTIAQQLSSSALSNHSFTGIAILAVCALILGPDSTQAKDIHRALSPLSGSLLVIGGGFVCLGPIDMALAAVSTGPDRTQHFEISRRLVSTDDLAGWRDATEREITAITNSH